MKIIDVDVYNFKLYFANGYKFEDFVAEACKITNLKPDQFEKNSPAVYHFFRSDFNEDLHKIAFLYSEEYLVLSFSEIGKLLPVFSHEITHVKNIIFSQRGIISSVSNDEHEACLTEFLMRKLIENL